MSETLHAEPARPLLTAHTSTGHWPNCLGVSCCCVDTDTTDIRRDIVGFTDIASTLPPEKVMLMLDRCAHSHGVYILLPS